MSLLNKTQRSAVRLVDQEYLKRVYIYIDAFLFDTPTPSRFSISRIRMDVSNDIVPRKTVHPCWFTFLNISPNSSPFSCSFLLFSFFTIEVLNIKKIRKQWYVKKRILKEMDTCVIKDYTNIRNTLEPISLILAFSGIFSLDRYRIFGSR